MKPIQIWQGTDKVIVISHNITELPQATEVAVYIDAPCQIIKTLNDGVSAVTAESLILTIEGADTTDAVPGEYSIEAKITNQSGGTDYGRISPSVVRILETSF